MRSVFPALMMLVMLWGCSAADRSPAPGSRDSAPPRERVESAGPGGSPRHDDAASRPAATRPDPPDAADAPLSSQPTPRAARPVRPLEPEPPVSDEPARLPSYVSVQQRIRPNEQERVRELSRRGDVVELRTENVQRLRLRRSGLTPGGGSIVLRIDEQSLEWARSEILDLRRTANGIWEVVEPGRR
jgi:hypothetical protein